MVLEHSGRPIGSISMYMYRPGMDDSSYLNQVLALSLGHEWLKLGCGEGVDETSF